MRPGEVRGWLIFFPIFIALLGMSCAARVSVERTSVMDTPEIHFDLGMKALESDKLDEAESEFKRAVELDEKYSRGYSGLAIATALKGDGEAAEGHLKKADKETKTDADKLIYCTATIRVETALQGKDWLEECEKYYKKGLKLEGSKEDLHYFYAFANEEAHQFDTAMGLYRKVIDLNEERVTQADNKWNRLQRVIRAQPGSSYGEEMALNDEITRGELATLLLEELHLDELFATRSSLSPLVGEEGPVEIPYDVRDHTLKSAIIKVLPWKLRGCYVDGNLFHPDRATTRGEFAMMVEDIIIKISGDEGLATRYITESQSPFADVESYSPYFNSAMVVTSKGILEADSSSMFGINTAISGADALLAFRKLKEYRW
jgi:tetratricopeptide (TPR) repeat protein